MIKSLPLNKKIDQKYTLKEYIVLTGKNIIKYSFWQITNRFSFFAKFF